MKVIAIRKSIRTVLPIVALAAVPWMFNGCATSDKAQSDSGDAGSSWWPHREAQQPGYQIAGTRDVSGVATGGEAPAQPKAPAPAPSKPAPAKEGWNSVAINMELVHMTKKVPATAALGETYECDLTVNAIVDVADVVVTDMIPDGTSLVKAEPQATVEGRKLTWRMDTLSKGQTSTIKLWLKAEKEGQLVNCATVHAIPHGCVATFVGKPAITIEKSGPATAKVGDSITYSVVVRNTGSALAKSVVVTDAVPEGLSAANGQKSLAYDFGDLAPNEAKKVDVALKADKRGKVCNVATAKSSNAGEVKAEACTTIVQPGLAVVKTGTKEQFIGRNASYQIVVSNTGDTALTDVVVTDNADADLKITTASGADVKGGQAVWKIAQLNAGEKQTFNVAATSGAAGSRCNNVSVSTKEGLKESSQACTLWKGVAAILLETKDDPDPLQVGESTTYTIRVTNQGTADDTNVKVVAKFAKEIDPASASTGGTISGKTVSFAPIARLAPKQSVTYTISAKAVSVGDHRLNVDLTSDILAEPVTHEESTHVY